MTDEKLQKVLAAAGLGSRREVERAIEAGEVMVNGRPAHLGERVKVGDKVIWRGESLVVPESARAEIRVLLYNKPEGEICSRNDPEGRPSVFDALPHLKNGRWVSVGRLDFNTSGLLLFTNDGELANKLMHPSSGIDREYMVRVQGEVEDDVLKRLGEGVLLDDGLARFSAVKRGGTGGGTNGWYHCVIMEGRNREVRRLWESQELRVSRLKRVRYGPILIPPFVKPGQWLELGDREISELFRRAGLEAPPKRRFRPEEASAAERRVKKMRAASGRQGRTGGGPPKGRKSGPSPDRTGPKTK
ncbi:MAG: pseudouridine synthase [Cellvibrionaceae bacterium]|nr:pseudouridine synthase [Cellvibrionaceae bacterium]